MLAWPVAASMVAISAGSGPMCRSTKVVGVSAGEWLVMGAPGSGAGLGSRPLCHGT